MFIIGLNYSKRPLHKPGSLKKELKIQSSPTIGALNEVGNASNRPDLFLSRFTEGKKTKSKNRIGRWLLIGFLMQLLDFQTFLHDS